MITTFFDQVNNAHQSGMIFSVIDTRMGSYPSECVEKLVGLAIKCCRDNPEERASMVEVVREVENVWGMMPDAESEIKECRLEGKVVTPPSSSSFFTPSYSQDLSTTYSTDAPITSLHPR